MGPIGCSTTVFAYGQTGTGKTHTMCGDLEDPSPNGWGLIPRSAAKIFEYCGQKDMLEWDIRCSYLEIYNEELKDLLVDEPNYEAALEALK